MEHWQDHGFILSVRPHGEGGAVVGVLTQHHGRHAGYVYGAASNHMRAILQPGMHVRIDWKARVADQLGTITLEQNSGLSPGLLQDSLKLSALLSACVLCDSALPEREGHEGLYQGFKTLMDIMAEDDSYGYSPLVPPAGGGKEQSDRGENSIWAAAYIYWELALLKELGFGLDLTRCAGGGDPATLAYVSPKSGRAVSYAAAEPYRDKLLELPAFLKPNGGPVDAEDILKGLKMTGYFLEHWAFAQHSKGVPEPRLRFEARYANYVAQPLE